MTSPSHPRFRFPEDRTAFVYQGAGQPILTPPRTALALYLDEDAILLADVLSPGGAVIENSTIYTGEDGLLPEFFGPPGSARVWARVVGTNTPAYPLIAQYHELLANRPELETSRGRPSNEVGVTGSWCIDEVDYVLYGPKSEAGWPPTGISLASDPDDVTPRSFIYSQISASDEWEIEHSLGYYPAVTVLDSFGEEVSGELTYPEMNKVVLRFSAPFSGRAFLS